MSSKFAYLDVVTPLNKRGWSTDTAARLPLEGKNESNHYPQTIKLIFRATGGYAATGAVIVALSEFFRFGLVVNATTAGFAFLLAILLASIFFTPAVLIFMSVVATLAFDYFFLPPIGTFNISDPQDWVALVAFVATALIGGQLSARVRQREAQANRKRQEVDELYDLSQKLLSSGNPNELFNLIPIHLMESFNAGEAALFHSDKGDIFRSGINAPQLDGAQLKTVALSGIARYDSERSAYFAPVRLGAQVVGSFGISGSAVSHETLEAVGSLLAVAIDRARAVELLAKLEAMRESERLKSVLLDAITHDFRTPLTSIKVSATGLLDDLEFDRDQRKELLTIIDEECDRISNLVGEAAEMARLESDEVKLELGSHAVGELISAALAECREVTRERTVSIHGNNLELRLHVDLSLATKVLVHLVTNAHRYSSPGRPITIASDEADGFHFISVADQGPGIDETEVSMIFEKFYRGRHQRYRVQGTGMGLPIAKAIVEAHGGTIRVVSRVGYGSVFTVSLPVER
jgi:two-component system sensor histidine kinase KdpD